MGNELHSYPKTLQVLGPLSQRYKEKSKIYPTRAKKVESWRIGSEPWNASLVDYRLWCAGERARFRASNVSGSIIYLGREKFSDFISVFFFCSSEISRWKKNQSLSFSIRRWFGMIMMIVCKLFIAQSMTLRYYSPAGLPFRLIYLYFFSFRWSQRARGPWENHTIFS